MKNHPIVEKVRYLTSGMTRTQLEELLAKMYAKDFTQLYTWLDNNGHSLSAYEKECVEGKHHPAYMGFAIVNWLIGAWKRNRRVVFVADAMRDDLKPRRQIILDKCIAAGESEDYGKSVFIDALKLLLEELKNG